jgi:glycosyltransferase involved in cell wall biosynthesis
VNIVYITAIEDPVRSPLIRSQVIGLLKAMAVRKTDHAIHLVCLYPLLNRLRFGHGLKDLRNSLAGQGIVLHILPILFLTRHFYIPILLLPFYRFQAFLSALWIGIRLRPEITHCRSYPAAIVGRFVKRICNAPFIFDTRAHYPEEGATRTGGVKRAGLLGAPSFHRWKEMEEVLIMEAGATIAVSEPSLKVFASHYPRFMATMRVVPACTEVFSSEEVRRWRRQMRVNLGLSDRLVLAYAGSWLEQAVLVDAFDLCRDALPDADWYLLLMAAASAEREGQELKTLIEQGTGGNQVCTAISLPHPQVRYHLAAADLAVLPIGFSGPSRDDTRYALMNSTVLSVKFTEYLACGLPVLVSKWAGAAADIVRTHDLGIVYDEVSPEDLNKWFDQWQNRRSDYRERALHYAHQHFSYESAVNGYIDIYRAAIAGGEHFSS